MHSVWSDGIHTVGTILRQAEMRGLDYISITDHNEIRGCLRAIKLSEKFDIEVIPGVELYFRVGAKLYELLAYFPSIEIYKDFFASYRERGLFLPEFESKKDVVDLIRQFSGFVMIPHPYGKNGFLRDEEGDGGFSKIGIEEVNASTGDNMNERSQKLNHYLAFSGADMHVYFSSMDRAFTLFKSEKPITDELLWKNLHHEEESIEFIPVGNSQPMVMRYFKKFICSFTVIGYLSRQYVNSVFRKNIVDKITKKS